MEIAARELDCNLILALFSLKKRFNVFIGDSFTYRYLLKKKLLNPGIVLTKSVTHGEAKSKLHDLFKSQDFKLTAIDHEHGLLDELNYKKYFIKSRIDKNEFKKFDAFFCWGNYDYKNLRKEFPLYKKKFFLTGSHRVDAWKSCKKDNSYNEKNKKNIGIFTNFALSNNMYGIKEYFRLKRKAGYYIRCPKLLSKDKLFLKYQKKNIKKLLHLVNYLPDKYPFYNFLVKIHPVENKKFWQKKLIKRNNLKIVETDNSTSLIKSCDLIIQTRCTTSVEAAVNEIKHINYVPLKAKHGFGNFVDKFSYNAKNIWQVKKLINSLLRVKKDNYKKYKLLNSRFMFKNTNQSSEKITKILKQLVVTLDKKNFQNNLKIKISLLVYEFFIKLKKNIYSILFNFKNINEYKFPYFSKSILLKKIYRLSKYYNFETNLKITKLGNRFWLFENKRII
jgi:surface carbohydrate biosynthesis protein